MQRLPCTVRCAVQNAVQNDDRHGTMRLVDAASPLHGRYAVQYDVQSDARLADDVRLAGVRNESPCSECQTFGATLLITALAG